MYFYDIIEKKRNKQHLSKEEIDFAVHAFVEGSVSKEQMSSLLMAIVLNGMTYEETLNLTLAMKNSSETLEFKEYLVDKHSTGGVSDSTTLILTPTLAALGVKVAKMSGRSLGFTGGTIDKLEVFEGYNANKTLEEFTGIINKINCSIISQTANLAYADKLIYDLRNKTATVDSIPLIASSIMSKKLASGAKFLVLNVHYGSGAFMQRKKDAIKLARVMVKIGNDSGVLTRACVSNMNVPLASGVGCTNEVISVVHAINGEQSNLLKLSKELCVIILCEVKKISSSVALKLVNETLHSGKTLAKLKELISEHGGKTEILDNINSVAKAKYKVNLTSKEQGYVKNIDARTVAKAVNHLKELNKDESTKKLVGVNLNVKVNTKVKPDDVLLEIFVNDKKHAEKVTDELYHAFRFSRFKTKEKKLIAKII
jgi:pyrimidine-nucleoside phosphorylase